MKWGGGGRSGIDHNGKYARYTEGDDEGEGIASSTSSCRGGEVRDIHLSTITITFAVETSTTRGGPHGEGGHVGAWGLAANGPWS